jgi:hypothetical protein
MKFVRDSSMSNCFWASVTGSWIRRAVFVRTVSIKPADFTRMAVDARVKVISPLLTNEYGSVLRKAGMLAITSDV